MTPRALVEQALSRQLQDAVWEHLVNLGWISEYEGDPHGTLPGLVKAARELLEMVDRVRAERSSAAERRGSTGPAPRRSRAHALEALDVARVEDLDTALGVSLIEFRDHYLDARRLLRPGEEVYEWIEERVAEDSPPTWLRVRLPEAHALRTSTVPLWSGGFADRFAPQPPITVGLGEDNYLADGLQQVTMIVPDPDGPTEITIDEDGVLGELHRLAGRVAREVGWTELEAVEFILTGSPPNAPLVDGTAVRPGARIVLSVHPSVTTRELVAAYSRIRSERGLALRNINDKRTALAAFIAGRPPIEPPGGRRHRSETWALRMTAWNAGLDEERRQRWSYRQVSNFARDAAQAQRGMDARRAAAQER